MISLARAYHVVDDLKYSDFREFFRLLAMDRYKLSENPCPALSHIR